MRANIFKKALLFIISFELLSFLVYSVSGASNFAFIIMIGLFLGIGFINLRLAILIAMVELFIGGMGYLFFYDLGGAQISLRIGIFLVLLSIWVLELAKARGITSFLKSKFLIPYAILFGFLAIGLVNALIRGNTFSNVFFDVNAYLFFTYIFILYDLLKDKNMWDEIWTVGLACFTWLGIKTMIVLYFFSHGIEWAVWPIYHWVRNTGVGEITLMTSNIFRVFFQSHIYSLIGLAIFATILFLNRHKLNRLERHLLSGAMALGCATVLISLSRSFWAGALACLPIILFFFFYNKQSLTKLVKRSFIGLMIVAFSFLFLFSVVKFPIPDPGDSSFGSLLKERSNIGDEAAASSRWNLWPELWSGILKEPFLGQGFGATVTYISNDPRVREVSPSGEYTTYAFEWGLLDIWYKIGFLGVLAYMWVLFKVSKEGIGIYIKNRGNIMPLALVCGLIVLFVANFFTPYLNHPLGIGYLILVTKYFDK